MLDIAFNERLLREIAALNRRFVRLLLDGAASDQVALDAALAADLRRASQSPRALFEHCPFLLFRIVTDTEARVCDVQLPPYDERVGHLTSVSLSFLWQLARDDQTAAQIVSGAGPAWCEALASRPLVSLTQLSVRAHLQPRLVDVPCFWQDLSRRRGLSALQRASMGAAGLQLILSRSRRQRVERDFALTARP